MAFDEQLASANDFRPRMERNRAHAFGSYAMIFDFQQQPVHAGNRVRMVGIPGILKILIVRLKLVRRLTVRTYRVQAEIRHDQAYGFYGRLDRSGFRTIFGESFRRDDVSQFERGRMNRMRLPDRLPFQRFQN